MSTKFEQLLDYLVNEEMEKANELFHEIVVEKSREIYENLISDELAEEEEDQQDESMESDDGEQQDESIEEMELEDSFMADDEEDGDMPSDMMGPDDATDDMLGDVEVDSDSSDDEAIMDIKNAIADLEAAFAELEAAKGADEMGMGDEEGEVFGDEEDNEENMEMMGMVREYRETVAKPSGDVAGANTGEKMSAAGATKSPISSGKGKPTSGATAGNIVGKSDTANEDGTAPKGKVGGVVKQGGQFTDSSTQNVGTTKSGVKTLSKVAQKSDAEGHAAGAGTGENSVKGATNTKSVVDHKIG